jgi:hypothetical protein
VAGELLLDTSGLVSILDRSQSHHAPCVSVYEAWQRPVLTTDAVVTEATHLLGRTVGGAAACLRFFVDGGALLVPGNRETMERSLELIEKYSDLPLDYADATLVVLAEDARVGDILTLDRKGFSAVRWARTKAFHILPD